MDDPVIAPALDYRGLLATAAARADDSVPAFASAIADRWCDAYGTTTSWAPAIVEFTLGRLTYLFDLAPSQLRDSGTADDRVVGVFGHATPALVPRDRSRQAGFIPEPARWSLAGYDRGHFVAHSLGGGLDVNVFPQARELNRGWSAAGSRWRALERLAARREAFLFVRPLYDTPSWVPRTLEFGVLVDDELELDSFDNRSVRA